MYRYDLDAFIGLLLFVFEAVAASARGIALLLFELVAAHVSILNFLINGPLFRHLFNEFLVCNKLLLDHLKLVTVQSGVVIQLILRRIFQQILISLGEFKLGGAPLHDVFHLLLKPQLLR